MEKHKPGTAQQDKGTRKRKYTAVEKYKLRKRDIRQINGILWGWFKDIFFAFIIVLALYTYVFQFSQIKGNSMYPTLEDGERVLVEKITGWAGEFNRGDIVTLKYPEDISISYVKRIIAFENETITIKRGVVYVNGRPLKEDYVKNIEPYDEMLPVTVPKGYLFVMGDNRPASSDSRRWGFLPKGYAYGRVLFIFWPPHSIGAVN